MLPLPHPNQTLVFLSKNEAVVFQKVLNNPD
jgi:hypothetical protein